MTSFVFLFGVAFASTASPPVKFIKRLAYCAAWADLPPCCVVVVVEVVTIVVVAAAAVEVVEVVAVVAA